MKYIDTNEYLECVNSLKFVSELKKKIRKEPYNWKWTIISFHNALQSIMVMSLQGSNGLLTLKKKSEEAWLKAYYENSPKNPRLELDNFLNLYKKIKSSSHLNYFQSKKYCPPGTQDWAMEKLNALRNDFIHFGPKLWTIEISGLPGIILDCLDIARFQCCESGTIFFTDRRPLKPIVQELNKQEKFFKKLNEEYKNFA